MPIHNTQLLQEQKNKLIEEIIQGQNRNYIKVFDIEAGAGKTRTTERGIALGVQKGQRYIFVRQFNVDCVESANIINALCGVTVALPFNNEIYGTAAKQLIAEKTLSNYPVVIITHAKYIALMANNQKRKIFTDGRDTLIIDEFIDTMSKMQINYDDLNTLKVFFEYNGELLYQYLTLVSQLQDKLVSSPINKSIFKIELKSAKSKFSKFERCIRANMTSALIKQRIKAIKNKNLKNINLALLDSFTTVSALCRVVENIKQFYSSPCLTDRGVIYTTDSRIKMWLLDNNIMLDASGSLQVSYGLDAKLYRLANCEKVFDHSRWVLTNIKLNTTNAGIGRVTNYYNVVNNIIKDCGESTLVVSSKSDIDKIQAPDGCKAYHYNLIGSNKWANLQNVIIAQTPNLDDNDYILRYLHYSNTINDIQTLSTKTIGSRGQTRYCFVDPMLEQIRTKHIAETIYQALKRVNRSMELETKAIVICSNDDAFKLIAEQLRGCNVNTVLDDRFVVEASKRDIYNQIQKNQSLGARFMTLLSELQEGKHTELQYVDKQGVLHRGKYKKADLRKYLGIEKTDTFSKHVLAKTDVMTFCRVREINTDGQFITFTCRLIKAA